MTDPQGSGKRLVARLFTIGAARLFSTGKKFIRPACRYDFFACGTACHDKPVVGRNVAPPLVYDTFQVILEENKIGPVIDCGILRRFLPDLAATYKFLGVARAI